MENNSLLDKQFLRDKTSVSIYLYLKRLVLMIFSIVYLMYKEAYLHNYIIIFKMIKIKINGFAKHIQPVLK